MNLLLLLAACSSEPTPTPPVKVEQPTEQASEQRQRPRLRLPSGSLVGPGGPGLSRPNFKVPGASFEQVKQTCCTNARVNRVLDKYLDLQQALAGEADIAAAFAALEASALDAKAEGNLDGPAVASVGAIAVRAEAVKELPRTEQSLAFVEITRHLELLLNQYAGSGRPIGRAKDPQTKLHWYQRDGVPRNPLGGDKAVFARD